jgi:hypothetical protein
MYGVCIGLRDIIRTDIFQAFWSEFSDDKPISEMTEDEIDEILLNDDLLIFSSWFTKEYSLSCFFLDEEDQEEFDLSRSEMKKNDPDVPDYGILIGKTYGDRFKNIKGGKKLKNGKTSIDRTVRMPGKQTMGGLLEAKKFFEEEIKKPEYSSIRDFLVNADIQSTEIEIEN